MTSGLLHILLLIAFLLGRAIFTTHDRLRAWPLVAWFIAPLAFGPYLVISDFLFEGVPHWVFYGLAGFACAALAGFAYVAKAQKRWSAFIAFLALLSFTAINGVTAHFESGPTPGLTDQPMTVLALCCVLTVGVMATLDAWQYRRSGWVRWGLPSLFLFFAFVGIV